MSGPPLSHEDVFAKAKQLRDAGVPLPEIDAYMSAKLGTPSDADSTALFREHGLLHDPNAIHREFASGNLPKRMATENQQEADLLAAEPSYAQKALGGMAALIRHAPGGEAVQSGARALVRQQPYRQAREEIRTAEAGNPASGANSFLGGALSAAGIPGSPMLQGARYGIAEGLLDANPDANLKDRLHSAAWRGATGAVVGKTAELGVNALRTGNAKPLGQNALDRNTAMRAADRENYGQATAEGNAAAQSPALRSALDAPDVKPFADKVRASRQFASADEATVARETYKLLSKQQGGLAQRLKEQGFDADLQLQHDNIGLAKRALLQATGEASTRPALTMDVPESTVTVDGVRLPARHPSLRQALADFEGRKTEVARRGEGTTQQQRGRQALDYRSAESQADPARVAPQSAQTASVAIETPAMRVQTAPSETIPPVMPTFPTAVSEHARMSKNTEAFEAASDATRRIINQTPIAGKKLLTKSPEAFSASIPGMSREQASAATEGLFGRAKEQASAFTPNPLKLFGLPESIVRLSRVSPFVRQLDAQAGNDLPAILRAAGLSLGTPSP